MKSPRVLLWIQWLLVVAPVALAAVKPASPFAWVPSYPSAYGLTTRTARTGGQLTYNCEFHTKDNGAAVRAFYENKLQDAGFHLIGKGGITGNSWDLYGENPDGTLTIDLGGDAETEGTKVRITAHRNLGKGNRP